jgi:SnoaL-like domain
MASPASNAFRAAIESRDAAALRAVLHPEIEFRSPAVYRPYRELSAVVRLVGVVFEVLEDFRYVSGIRQGDEETLRFAARVAGREIEGVDLIRYDDDGRVRELTVMIRPFTGLRAVADLVGARLSEIDSTAEQHA